VLLYFAIAPILSSKLSWSRPRCFLGLVEISGGHSRLTFSEFRLKTELFHGDFSVFGD